jgi:DNA-binding IclR family transcriptional regulator
MMPSRAQWQAAYDALAALARTNRVSVSFGATTDREPVVVTWHEPPLGGARHLKGSDLPKLATAASEGRAV